MADETCCSCPGKVLLAGGYLVLDNAHRGLVVATASRFYTVVRSAAPARADETVWTVRSPQFTDGVWQYRIHKDEQGCWRASHVDTLGSSANKFVHLSVSATLLLASALVQSFAPTSLSITILGANDFYSQPRAHDAPPREPFALLNTAIADVHKTGLGSSAAMVSSLCSALLEHLTHIGVSSATASAAPASTLGQQRPLELVHNLVQYVHSLAQGKVGSGFDVSSAIWGTHVYRRFDPVCLKVLLDESDVSKLAPQELLSQLSLSGNAAWTGDSTCARVTPFALPRRTTLVLADVDAGSNTPSMVGKVLKWRQEHAEAASRLWSDLSASNDAIADLILQLASAAEEDSQSYNATIDALAARKPETWPSRNTAEGKRTFTALHEQFRETRRLMREMGEQAGTPVEPPEQTRLLDACMALPGVVGAGVPGAGGYDAVWILVIDAGDAQAGLERLLSSWTEMSVKTLEPSAFVRGDSIERSKGLFMPQVDDVPGLRKRL